MLKNLALATLASLLLASCVHQSPSTAPSTLAVAVQTAAPNVPASSKLASDWVTPAVVAPGVEQRTFHSRLVGGSVSYMVYVPPDYRTDPDRRLPVLYWLHGTGGGLAGVPRVTAHFDEAIRARQVPPMLVVLPNGMKSSMYVDSKDGRVPMERVLITELIPEVDRSFRTVASREGRIVEGFSMGGYGAGRLGFKHHQLFRAVSMLASGPLQPELIDTPRVPEAERKRLLATTYGGDQAYFRDQSPWVEAERNAAALRQNVAIRLVVGDRDETYPNNLRFHEHLLALGIAHEYIVVPGVDHNARLILDALTAQGWDFYRKAFGPAR